MSPKWSFVVALARIIGVLIYGSLLKRLGKKGKRKAGILAYKAFKKIVPLMAALIEADDKETIGVMEGGINKRKLRDYIRKLRRRSLALRET